MSSQEIISMVFQLVLTGGIGVITYFLKRTISDIDNCKHDIDKIKDNYVTRNEVNGLKDDVMQVKQNYLTKEDFYREQNKTDKKLDKIMDILMELKEGKN
ncbi:MAG: hypothetical protein ACI4RC_04200 [Oscillospiraceae bacterium]